MLKIIVMIVILRNTKTKEDLNFFLSKGQITNIFDFVVSVAATHFALRESPRTKGNQVGMVKFH